MPYISSENKNKEEACDSGFGNVYLDRISTRQGLLINCEKPEDRQPYRPGRRRCPAPYPARRLRPPDLAER